MPIVAAIAGAAVGSIATLLVKMFLDRRAESRGARREFYVELLTLLVGRARGVRQVSFAPRETMPEDIPQERIDRLDALLLIDASAEVRELANRCLRTLGKFNASHLMWAPVDVDEHGLYHYRFEQVRGVDEETAQLVMRVALGGISDQLSQELDALSARVRKELHGSRA